MYTSLDVAQNHQVSWFFESVVLSNCCMLCSGLPPIYCTCSAKKIRAELGETGLRISRRTISRRLTDEFRLKSRKPAWKPRLTPAMKLKRLQFAKKYKDWTSQQWSRVLFSGETTIQQFASRKRTVRRPPGTRYNVRLTQQTMKHPPSVMIWGAI